MESRFSKISIEEDTGPKSILDQNGTEMENDFHSIDPDQTSQSPQLQLNAADKSEVDEMVKLLSDYYNDYCAACRLDMYTRDAFCWYENGDVIRYSVRRIEKLKKDVTNSNLDEFWDIFSKTEQMIKNEMKKILDTIPDNSTAAGQQPSQSLLESPRIHIIPYHLAQLNAEAKKILDTAPNKFECFSNFARLSNSMSPKLDGIVPGDHMRLNAASTTQPTRYITSDNRHISDEDSCACSNLLYREIMPRILYVGNLCKRVTEQLIETLFEKVGPVFKTKIFFDADGNPYAFVEFHLPHDAHIAHIFMNNHTLDGLKMKVKWAKKVLAKNGKCYYYVEQLEGYSVDDSLNITSMNERTGIIPRNVPSRSLKIVHFKNHNKLKPYVVIPSISKRK